MLLVMVIFNLGPNKLCSSVMIEAYFSYDKNMWIAVTDNCMYFYLFMLFLLVEVFN